MDDIEKWLLNPETTFEEIDKIANGEENEQNTDL